MPSIYDRLTKFSQNRLPDMVKLKYQAMALNIFSFYRGTCHLFYEDLAAADTLQQSPITWICGDLHLENFGSFKGDNNEVYFDLNDFDEAMLAPAAWEIVRLVTSIFVAFEGLGLAQKEALKVAELFLHTYSATLKRGKAKSIDPRTAEGIVHEFLKKVEKRKQKELLKKCTQKDGGKLKLLTDERHFAVDDGLKRELIAFIDSIINTIHCFAGDYETLDCVFRVAGTGSIGVKRYLFLLRNRNLKKKYLLLGMKQALPSSLKPFLSTPQPQWESEAVRVATIQERMQNVPPALLTPVIFRGEPYLLKQMQPKEDKINFADLGHHDDEIDRVIYDMAVLSASAQLRTGGSGGSAITDELIAFSENEWWMPELLKYAQKYTETVKKDYKEFMTGFKKGKYD